MNLFVQMVLSALLLLLFGLAPVPASAALDPGIPQKPAELDDAAWTSLQAAVRKSISQQARLTGDGSGPAADGAADDNFGRSVDIDGDMAIVGVQADDVGANSNQGSAYVYRRHGSTWTLEAKLVAADGAASDQFGYSVALSGDTALVGAWLDDVSANTDQGSVYVYTRSGTTWAQQAKLIAADGGEGDNFGFSVDVVGDTALVGARTADVGANIGQGSAYVYVRTGTTWMQQSKLIAADGATGDQFGYTVALAGDTALVGAYLDSVGANARQGSAYVYIRSGAMWTQQAKLVAGDGAADDRFGFSVAVDGDTALVGASQDNVGANFRQGSAYVFTRDGAMWIQQAKLLASDGAANDRFGSSVALSGDTALVGAFADNVGVIPQGSAYMYIRSGTTWIQQAKVLAADGASGDQFGNAVALSGDTALVGAQLDDVDANSNQGSAYVYTRSGTTWMQQAQLVTGDGAANDQFGYSVALAGDTALVGAYLDDVGANVDQGTVYVFIRNGATWTQQAQLVAADGAANDRFGTSVALSGDTALVGAYQGTVGVNSQQGAAYVFTRGGTTWTQQAKLVAADGAASDHFGWSAALVGDTALVGARLDTVGANSQQGSVYVYVRSGTAWSQQAKLVAADGAASELFGNSVALSEDTALIGAYLDAVGANSQQGSAYVYIRSGTTWTQQAKLVAGDGATSDNFGWSVALSGDTALVAAYSDDVDANVNQGSAYVYIRSGATWTQQAKLVAGDGADNDFFGYSVGLAGDTALVGARLDAVGANGQQGSAYVFTRSGTTWTWQTKLVATDGAANDLFGTSVAFAGNMALVGASRVDGPAPFGNPDEGAAYVFSGIGLDDSTTTITSALPDASLPGQAVSVAVSVSGAIAMPSDGVVTVTASTGEFCTDLTPTTGSGTTALFDCPITFNSVGPRTLIASFSDSATHIDSSSAAEPHAVITVIEVAPATVPNGVFGASYSQNLSASGPGSTPPYAFSFSGTLPAGVVLDGTTGMLSGTLNATGVFEFEITATDSSGAGVGGPFSGVRSYSVTIAQASQATLSAFASSASIAFGEASTLSTSGGSGLGAVTYAVTAGGTFCSVTGATLTGTGVGTCTVTATKAADANYTAATATVDISVVQATQATLSAFASPPTIPFGQTSTLSSSGGSGLGAVTYAVTAGETFCSVTGATLTGTGVGTCTVTATKAADTNYIAATATVDIGVVQATQATLSAFASPATIPFGQTSTLSTNGGSGLGAVTYAVTAGGTFCSVTGTTLTGTGVGTCTVTATKAADSNYTAATATVDIEVLPAANLQISKDDGMQYALPGGFVEYQIVVGNAGPLAVSGARVTDPVPTGLANAMWTCAAVQGASCPAPSGNGGIDELVDLPVDSVLRYVLSANVTAPLGDTITNTATVTVPAGTVELDGADNSSSDSNTVVPDGLFGDGFEQPNTVLSWPQMRE